MSPATPLRSLKAMMTATNASLPLDLKPASKRISNRYDAFVSIEVEDMVNCSPKCAKLLPTMICCYIAYDFDDFTLLSRQPIEIIIRICIDQRSWHKHQLSSADSLGVGCLTGNKKGKNETLDNTWCVLLHLCSCKDKTVM